MFSKAIERLPRGADHRATAEPFLKSEYLADDFVRTMFHSAWKPVLDRSVDFVKFPQLALSIDFLFEQFPDIHVIALWRDPVRTFRSLVTKEFPVTMIPASGLKAILLWNTYAYHIVQGQQKRPDEVTVLNIDQLIERDSSISPLLRRLGYEVAGEHTLSQCMQAGVWTQRTPWPWKLYFGSMRLGILAMKRWVAQDKEALTDLRTWKSRLLAVTTDL